MQRLSRVAAFKGLARDIKGNKEFKTWLQSTGAEMDVPVVWDEDKPLSKSIFSLVWHSVYGFKVECQKISFTALLEGIFATLNSRTQKTQIQSRMFIWRMLFWRYHGQHKNSEN